MFRKKAFLTISVVLLALVGPVVVVTAGGGREALTSGDGPYRVYTEEAFGGAEDLRRVLFFHASWCPSCRQAARDINANLDALPDDAVIFKTDYDLEKALKQKYGITYQHTFVYVDASGEAIDTWSGGSVKEIVEHIDG